MRIVMLGKTGVGKSSVANTIFGENVFKIGHTGYSETRECRSETRRVDGRDVTLIDTPGWFNMYRPEEELKPKIVNRFVEFAPGPHAFIIVLKVERFTEQEVINKINQYFSEEAFKYATVLFTHGDDLQEGQTVEQYFHNDHLVRDLVKKCGGRCHVVDNKYWKNNQPYDYRCNQFQVKQLMKTIDHMIEANKGRCYNNKMLQAVEKLRQEEEKLRQAVEKLRQAVEKLRQEEEKQIRQSPGNKTENEIREEAKERVSERLLINLAGVAAGVLLGALPGVVLVVGAAGPIGLAACLEIVAGVLGGAIKGYNAAKEADTPSEAAKAVFNDVIPFFKDQKKQQ